MPSETPRLVNGSCLHCAGHFEFDPADSGRSVACPHCGQETPLFSLSISFDGIAAPSKSPPPASSQPTAEDKADTDAVLAHYASGGPVRLGDRVRYGEGFAQVVFVSNGEREACLPGYEDYSGYDACIVICDDDGETSVLREDDPELEKV